jgi:pimeloyl-ACP methyl ester carboxylesterase
MITETRARYDGVSTRVLSVAGNGTPIVLLHGFADSVDTWRCLMSELEAAGHAAIAVDLPGFGAADARRPGDLMPQLDWFVDAIVAELGPVILIGNSLGACLSVRAASRGSANVRGVVAVDEPILASNAVVRIARGRRDPLGILDHRLPVPSCVYRKLIRRALTRALYGDPTSADPDTVSRFTSQMPDIASLRRVLADARIVALETAGGYDSENVHCPLLVVHGRRDRVIPVHASVRLHRSVPGSTLVVMEHSGHCPQLDDPAGLTKYVLQFLDSERPNVGHQAV